MHGGLFWVLYLTGIQQEERDIETRTRRKRRRRRRRDNSGKEDETVSAETAVPKLTSHPLLSDEPLTIPPALLGNTATESHKLISSVTVSLFFSIITQCIWSEIRYYKQYQCNNTWLVIACSKRSLLFFRAPFYFAPLPTIWTPGTG